MGLWTSTLNRNNQIGSVGLHDVVLTKQTSIVPNDILKYIFEYLDAVKIQIV